jgi:hypothetical protein
MVVEGGRRWKKGWAQFTSDITHATNRLEGLAVTFEISHGLRRSSDWFEEKGKKKRTNNILIFHSFFFFLFKILLLLLFETMEIKSRMSSRRNVGLRDWPPNVLME